MTRGLRAAKLLCALAVAPLSGCDRSTTREPDRAVQAMTRQPVADGAARVRYPAGYHQVLTLPDGEREPVRSLLDIDRPMAFGDYVWSDAGIAPGPVWLRVDLSRQMISVFRNGHEIGSAVILFGADDKPTPLGVYPVLGKAKLHQSTLYDAEMPYMLRLTGDGVAIHASTVRKWAATHGCIGVPLDFAKKLFDAVQRGDKVAIVRSAVGQPNPA